MTDTIGARLSPLGAFYQRERELADEICCVQPLPNGELVKLNWTEFGHQVRTLAAYLESLGLEPGSNIALMSSNCAYWIIADLAIWMAGHTSVPIYPVLTGKSVRQILDHSGAKLMFAGKLEGWQGISAELPEALPLITFPLPSSVPENAGTAWQQILTDFTPYPKSPERSLDEVATIIYTSGTTGMPKGVMHTFHNLAVVGVASGELYDMTPADRKISYLPLAHVAERAAIEVNQLYYGFRVYFSWSLETFGADLKRAKPTMLFAVPRIWTKFQQGVLGKMPANRLDRLLKIPFVSGRIRKKVLEGMGLDQVRIAVSGAAPLSTHLMDWYRSLGIDILEGYAMSENFAFSHATKPGEAKFGYVGTPSPGVVCKFSDDGELLIKSPANTPGYYKEPELTAALFDAEGYLRTGDTGELDAQGRLRITGRIKEIFKTSKGKYVAPAPIEDKLLANRDIEQVCVTGNSLPAPIAIAILSEAAIQRLGTAGGKAQIAEQLEKDLRQVNSQLDKHENLSTLVVAADLWSVENGFMTPTLKIKRTVLEKVYGGSFEQWQGQSAAVVWADKAL